MNHVQVAETLLEESRTNVLTPVDVSNAGSSSSIISNSSVLTCKPRSIEDVPLLLRELSPNEKPETRQRNPIFLISPQIANERTEELAQKMLCTELGGRYQNQTPPKHYPVISFYEAIKLKRRGSAHDIAVLKTLCMHDKFSGLFDHPAMLFKVVDGVSIMNSGSKSKIRLGLRTLFEGTGAFGWSSCVGDIRADLSWKQVRLKSKDGKIIEVEVILFDGPMIARRIAPFSYSATSTGVDVLCAYLRQFVKTQKLLGYKDVIIVEELGGCLQKKPTESVRDETKGAPPKEFTLGSLGVQTKNYAVDNYLNRSGRAAWQREFGNFLSTNDTVTEEKIIEAIGGNNKNFSGTVGIAGVGLTREDRQMVTYLSVDKSLPKPRLIRWTDDSSIYLEDINMAYLAFLNLKKGKNVIIVVEDTDLISICILLIDWIRHSKLNLSASLLLKVSEQNIKLANGSTFVEEYINCSELAQCIFNNPSCAEIEERFRVPSIVALNILAGGDTTSYCYLPHNKLMEWYWEYIEYVGSLVRYPNEDESVKGYTLMIDEAAVERLFKLGYACKNVTVIPRWTSLSKGEKLIALRDTTFFGLQCSVATKRLARIIYYMPNIENLRLHIFRAQGKFHQWIHVHYGRVPDVPLTGFDVHLTHPDHVIDTVLRQPTYAIVLSYESNNYVVSKVTPISVINTKHSELFPNGGPSATDVINAQGSVPNTSTCLTDNELKILREARTRVESKSKLTVPQMKSIVLGYHLQTSEVSKESFKALRKSLGNKLETVKAAYDALILTMDIDNMPWELMGWIETEDAEEESVELNLPQELDAEADEDEEEEADSDEEDETNDFAGNMIQNSGDEGKAISKSFDSLTPEQIRQQMVAAIS